MNKTDEQKFLRLHLRVSELAKFDCASVEEKYGYRSLIEFVMRSTTLPMTYIIADNNDDPLVGKWGLYLFPAGWLINVLGPELSGFFMTTHLFTINTYTYKDVLEKIYMFEKGYRAVKNMPVYVVDPESFDGDRNCGKIPKWITLKKWEELQNPKEGNK